jgi:AmmeMemoRadiSam system protein B
MKRMMSYLQENEKEPAVTTDLVAGISPHDDYLYAARVYFPLFRVIRPKEVVIFGVTHRTVRNEIGDPQNKIILDSHRYWVGLDRTVSVSSLREIIVGSLDTSLFIVSNKAHQLEHSIEALVPFLQYFNPEVKIVPIMITVMSFERMDTVTEKLSELFARYIADNRLVAGRDIMFLISSDADHYGKDFNNAPFGEDERAQQTGTSQDRRIAGDYLEGYATATKIKALSNELKDVVWCGRYSVPFGLLTAEKTFRKAYDKSMVGTVLRYSDTYSEGVLPLRKTGMGTTAPFSLKHWVGFLSAGYTLE